MEISIMVELYLIMKLIKKTYHGVDKETISKDINFAFNKLINKPEYIYHITLSNLPQKSLEEVKFRMKNNFLNSIWKDYKYSLSPLNYLFVIEYGGIISHQVNFEKIKDLGLHIHLILNTTLTENYLEYYIINHLGFIDYKIDRIDKNKDKIKLGGYLIKQYNILTSKNYEYKILN